MKNVRKQYDPVIVLMTDFGLEDTYVGQMKGVILSICPYARIIDLTHDIIPQHVAHGAFLLERALPFLPKHSIIVCVVDPGVGTSRKPIALKTDLLTFLAPDNGLLTPLFGHTDLRGCRCITNREIMLPKKSSTFHGRDIFSPAAAHLACGFAFDLLGSLLEPESCVTLPREKYRITGNGTVIDGSILFTDRFGNLVTTIDTSLFPDKDGWLLEAGGLEKALPISGTYGDAGEGELLAYGGSFGTLEIAVRNGNAALSTGMKEGTPVRLARKQKKPC